MSSYSCELGALAYVVYAVESNGELREVFADGSDST